MTTYVFEVELEPDEEGWRAFQPVLEEIGASTWGPTREDAVRNLEQVLALILEELAEAGETLPTASGVSVSDKPLVAVTR